MQKSFFKLLKILLQTNILKSVAFFPQVTLAALKLVEPIHFKFFLLEKIIFSQFSFAHWT